MPSAWHSSTLTSAWKSGPVQFFIQISKDRDQDQSSQVERPWKTGLNQHQPVQCGFSQFLMVLRLVLTSYSLNQLTTGLGPVLELLPWGSMNVIYCHDHHPSISSPSTLPSMSLSQAKPSVSSRRSSSKSNKSTSSTCDAFQVAIS